MMFKILMRSLSLVVLALGMAGAAQADSDPALVQQQFVDALNRADVAAALAMFTEDAVIDSESGQCASAPCVGRAAIQKDLERLAQDHSRRMTPLSTYVSGNVVVTRFEARSALIKSSGVERIVLWGIREMRGDKIATSRCCLPDRTDAQTARFLAWDYAHPTVQ